jgi:3-oxoacyl-[acyl-carrier protein] reductase
MDLGLVNRAAIVTGGASGIGAAAAIELAREGCDVALVDRRPPEEACDVLRAIETTGRRAHYLRADVRDENAADDGVASIAALFERVDILVYSAGINQDSVSWKMTGAQWDDVLGVNLTGCFYWNRATAIRMRERGWGRIVNVASINGIRGKFGQANYAASKGGMIALTKTLARELGRSHVTVNAVAPGMVRTPMTDTLPPKAIEVALGETATGRLADADDCAAAIVFLCSERARHLTGEVVCVDSGQSL